MTLEGRITECLNYSAELIIQKSKLSTIIGFVYLVVTRFELKSITVFHTVYSVVVITRLEL